MNHRSTDGQPCDPKTIAVGDCVRLPSGLRCMTVLGRDDGAGVVDCVWMDNGGRMQRDRFPVAVLVYAAPFMRPQAASVPPLNPHCFGSHELGNPVG